MAAARNAVLAGDYTGLRVFRMSPTLAYISGTMKKIEDIFLTQETVTRYEVLTEDIIRSGNSLLLTGALDPSGFARLRLHATQAMQEKGIYTVAMKFKDGKTCLMEIDDKIYTAIVRRMNT